MKDISKKSAEPLDLSEADNLVYSPYTLDLSEQTKKPSPKQTNFYEYMPAAMQQAQPMSGRDADKPHPDDEFGEKLQYWYESAAVGLRGAYAKSAVLVAGALRPLRQSWAVVVGAGLILGLLIISYIATHRNWITSFPTGMPAKTSGSIQSDKSQSPAASPGKGGAAGLQTATPVAAAGGGGPNGGGPAGSGSRGTGAVLPAVGGVPSSNTGSGGSVYYAPSSSSSSTAIVQPAPAPVPAPAPLPVAAPTPASAPILPAPVNNVLSPVKSLL
ncbi:MAG: hypothetical protein NVSMB39_2660 [Candidatus Saccharimonadales bacterium]